MQQRKQAAAADSSSSSVLGNCRVTDSSSRSVSSRSSSSSSNSSNSSSGSSKLQASKQASQQASKHAKVASNDSEVHDKLGKVHKPVAAREHPSFNQNALSVPPALLTRFHTPSAATQRRFFVVAP